MHTRTHTYALPTHMHIKLNLSGIHDNRVGDHFVLVVIASTDDAVVVWLCSCIVVCVRASEPGSERRISEFANNGYIYQLSERLFSPFPERIPSLNP